MRAGAIINLGFCRYAGKGQGEVSLLRRMWDILNPGDVLLADSLMSNWVGIVMLQYAWEKTITLSNGASQRRSDPLTGKHITHFQTS